MTSDPPDPIVDPARLAALRAARLLDTPPEEGFDQITGMATRLLNAPIALISLVDQDRQFFKSRVGKLPQAWGNLTETSLRESFCKFAVASQQPLIINDTHADPRVKDNPTTVEAGIGAYAGVPLTLPAGETIGTLCVLDLKPRAWSDEQILTLRSLASAVTSMITYRSGNSPKADGLDGALNQAQSDDPEAQTEAGGRLQRSVAAFLAGLDEYDRFIRAASSDPQALEQESRIMGEIAQTRERLLQTMREVGGRLAPASGAPADPDLRPAIDLYEACRSLIEAEERRDETAARFRNLQADLSEMERDVVLASNAEQALRFAERSFELSRG
jgi:signal transduction protein with GAF and PtsI domain